ncbi:MAG TPA: crosslink repair DNA glycosylase YcaQ family protein [Polyangiaceae bacterium]|nr:crosslink repair DNA glycosylase YcaQ family protein [Polyangiaceae bacterium]
MNAYLLIDAVVQQTMVFIAQLATAGGVRAPLAHVAEQVFAELTTELSNRGVKKNVIADMFGMALRTYHRRVRELAESKTESGRSVWEAVLGFIRDRGPVSGHDVLVRFAGDEADIVTGVLSDLSQSGLVYRAGRGDGARYRIAEDADFSNDDANVAPAREHLVWLAVYRNTPATEESVRGFTRLGAATCMTALDALVRSGRVVETRTAAGSTYTADVFEVPLGAPVGWEAAVLDHFQAMVSAIITKLSRGRAAGAPADQVGGSTWSLDVWRGHPLEVEAKSLLARTRAAVEELRTRVDAHNATAAHAGPGERVVFYAGQNVRDDQPVATQGEGRGDDLDDVS